MVEGDRRLGPLDGKEKTRVVGLEIFRFGGEIKEGKKKVLGVLFPFSFTRGTFNKGFLGFGSKKKKGF